MNTKSIQEIEQLKADWRRDPCWDIEETEGFEAHRDELLQYRQQYNAECEQNEKNRLQRLKRVWYDLTLNETARLDNYTSITRVPGGWIYSTTMCSKEPSSREHDDAEYVMNTVFIPYHLEFLESRHPLI